MGKILKIGKAFYKIDKKVSQEGEEKNKRKIDGFTRIFPDGRKKRFRFKI